MNWQHFVRHVLPELASVVGDPNHARALLEDAGFPRNRLPAFDSGAEAFWRAAARQADDGLIAGGLDTIARAATERYPFNQVFNPAGGSSPTEAADSGRTPSPQPFPPQTGARGPDPGSSGSPPQPDPGSSGSPSGPDPGSSGSSSGPGRLKVFLCHAHEDKVEVRKLYRRLRDSGFDPWFDEENLLPGQSWRREITRAVRGSHAVVVCLSRTLVRKAGFGQKEIKLALDVLDEQPEGAIFLIPARLEACEVPDRLSTQQYVDLFAEGGDDKLLRALRARAADLGLKAGS